MSIARGYVTNSPHSVGVPCGRIGKAWKIGMPAKTSELVIRVILRLP